MGLVVANSVGLSGLVAPKPNVQIITTSTDNVVIPAGSTRVYIEVIGGGGGGGGGTTAAGNGSGGGGGGSFVRSIFNASDLEPTVDVVVGAATSAAAGGNPATDGAAGNYSEVHGSSGSVVYLNAWGGGGGGGGGQASAGNRGGGGGGGTGGAGTSVTLSDTGGDGGDPDIQGSTHGDILGGRGW